MNSFTAPLPPGGKRAGLGLALSLAAVLALSAPTVLHAGLVLEQTVESEGSTSNTVMRLQDGMIRTDIDEELTTIANTQTREVLTLMHPVKQIMRINAPQADVTGKTVSLPAMPAPKYNITGATDTIDGHVCDIVTMEVMGMKSTYWVAKDYPDYDKIKEELAKLKHPGDTTLVPAEMNGLVLKTSTVSPTYASITTVTAVKIEEIAEPVFQAPDDYSEGRRR
ncbi:MAG: DUF4412 domain-containing protein [Verrucomicrobium sp.]|nr:DUF4412 domain-containing protein [Verrucomicrobium sp.]